MVQTEQVALKPTAFLVHQKTVHFTESTDHAVALLLESIWQQHPDHARSITRNRIFHVEPLSPLCQGMIKVVGKRSTQLEGVVADKLWIDSIADRQIISHSSSPFFAEPPLVLPEHPVTTQEAMGIAQEIARHSKLGIAAVLLDLDGRIISWGWNDHFNNRVMHAEIMLIKNYLHLHHQRIPSGATLITTLQPCAMCAGYLHAYSEKFLDLTIIFLEEDTGPFAQNSILIRDSDLYRKSGLIGIPRLIKF